MLDFHEKRKLKNIVYSKPTAAVLFVLAILLSMSVFERYKAERETAAKRAERAAELAELESRAAVLDAHVQRLQSDRGIEEEIRDRFEVARQGEEVVVIVGAADEPEDTTTPVHTEEVPGFFSRLLFWR